MGDRFTVTELRGFSYGGNGAGRGEGLSRHVIDTAYIRRVVATYRSEEVKRGTRAERQAKTQRSAAEHAARLNASR